MKNILLILVIMVSVSILAACGSDNSSPSPQPLSKSPLFNSVLTPTPTEAITPQSVTTSPSTAQSQKVDIDVDLSISGNAAVGEVAQLSATVTAQSDAPSTLVKITLPDTIHLVSGTLDWQDDLRSGEPVIITSEIKFVELDEWKIQAQWRYIDKELDVWSGVKHLYCGR